MEVFYNPRCSKCRSVGELLDGQGVAWKRLDYLRGELTREKLRAVIAKLGCGAGEIVRWDEPALKEKGITRQSGLSEEALIDLMLAHPIIVQRPIAISAEGAVIARPAERVLELL